MKKSVREAGLSLFVFMENLQFNIVFQKRKSIQNLCDCDQDLCICEIFDSSSAQRQTDKVIGDDLNDSHNRTRLKVRATHIMVKTLMINKNVKSKRQSILRIL